MTSKAGVKRAGLISPVSTTAAQPPSLLQQLTPKSKISASCISLSPRYIVHYSVFAALHTHQGYLDIDLARRKVFEGNAGKPVEDGLLTYSHVSKEESALWVFCIEQSPSGEEPMKPSLHTLDFSGLTRKVVDSFSYAELYPCSVGCSTRRTPCPACLQSSSDSDASVKTELDLRSNILSSSSSVNSSRRLPISCHLPRIPLRQPLTFFLNAVQERLINDVCESTSASGATARRLGSGIICGPSSPPSSWGDGWDQHWKTRPLSYCHIEVTLFSSGIFIQPRFRRTHFLSFLSSLPLSSGTPITLLPFSTPAYYLNMYCGSTSALTRQFHGNLMGLGAGNLLASLTSGESVQFVIAWLSVQNKQGEEKGMIVIWPAPLCVSLMSMTMPGSETTEESESNISSTSTRLFAYGRKPLAHIPELPIALQPSPVPAPATVPRAVSPHEHLVSPSLFTPIGGRISFSREPTPTTPFPPRSASQSAHPFNSSRPLHFTADRPPLIHATSSFSPPTTRHFRTLSIPSLPPSGMRNVAEGVGRFVDFMAKERERERERIKREKEREASVNAQATAGYAQGIMMKGPVVGVGTPQSPGIVPPKATSSIMNTLQAGTANEATGLTPGPASSITVNIQALANPHQAQTQNLQPPVPPNHPSYPSPPEEVGKAEHSMSFGKNGGISVPPSNSMQQAPPPAAPFDAFDNMDKFMMDIGMGMDFNMSLPSSTSHQGELVKVDFDSLGVFTDDDFSFFDDPVVTTTTSTTAVSGPMPELDGLTSDKTLKTFEIPSLGQDGVFSCVPDSTASLTTFDKSSPWSASKPAERRGGHGDSAPPELLPGSPDGSISSSTGPATPDIISTSDIQTINSGTNSFDPLRFSKRFHSADTKYAIGKFSSALIEKDSPTPETSVTVLWRMSYDSLTDPRIEVVKKLIGVKRRLSAQGVRLGLPCPPFQETKSEWESCADDDVSMMDVDSERDSDEEDQILDDYDVVDSVSRPSTPMASHLPLGPTLLSTQFQHSLLLPLSVNLKSPGASFAATLDMASPLPNPVPTPVSPAAVAGSTSEKSKSLEIVVRTLAIELVENTLWEEAWRASAIGQAPVWMQNECEGIDEGSSFLSTCWLWSPMSIKSLSSFAPLDSASSDNKPEKNNLSFETLEQPMFTVGKADILVQMSPPALRLWSKVGLTPRSGPKDIHTFVLYEEGGRPLDEVESLFVRVSLLYSAKGYGKHSLGKSSLCSKDGFVPVRYVTFRKTLTSLMDTLGKITFPIVIYVVTPSSILSISSPILRQIFSSINRVLSTREDDAPPVRFHLVPDFLLSFKDDVDSLSRFESFVDNVYNRIPRPVDRFMSRPFFAQTEKTRKYFEAPSFTLARSSPPTFLSFQHPPPDLSSVGRHTFCHVGYRLTKCKKWLVAACIDERGEGHDLGIWSVGDESDWKQPVGRVWAFATEFARRANVEWRLSIAKLGSLDETELGAWNDLLDEGLSDTSQILPMHVSLFCVDDESGWSVLPEEPSTRPPQKPPSSTDSHGKSQGTVHAQNQGHGQTQGQGQLFSSASSTYVLPTLRCPLPSSIDSDLGAAQYIAEDDDSKSNSTPRLHGANRLRPLLSSALVTVPSTSGFSPRAQSVHLLLAIAFSGSSLMKSTEDNMQDLCRNYHELAVLTQARWHFPRDKGEKEALPYHLAALRVVDSALEMNEIVTE